jgi:hypothetical protein
VQFDLDEHFASERLRLAQLTNKCNDDDLEFYIKESGEILGVTSQLMPNKCEASAAVSSLPRLSLARTLVRSSQRLLLLVALCVCRRSPKEILEYVFRQVVNFKKLNPDIGTSSDFGANGASACAEPFRAVTAYFLTYAAPLCTCRCRCHRLGTDCARDDHLRCVHERP